MSYDMWFTKGTESVNITYNHAPTFTKLFGSDGIRALYGKTAKEVEWIATAASRCLMSVKFKELEGLDEGWEPTNRNAMLALQRLRTAAAKSPSDAILEGD